jgi:hypothetical protein
MHLHLKCMWRSQWKLRFIRVRFQTSARRLCLTIGCRSENKRNKGTASVIIIDPITSNDNHDSKTISFIYSCRKSLLMSDPSREVFATVAPPRRSSSCYSVHYVKSHETFIHANCHLKLWASAEICLKEWLLQQDCKLKYRV